CAIRDDGYYFYAMDYW
nr:immunoglobulin heavy chain junction region [Mus musculus]